MKDKQRFARTLLAVFFSVVTVPCFAQQSDPQEKRKETDDEGDMARGRDAARDTRRTTRPENRDAVTNSRIRTATQNQDDPWTDDLYDWWADWWNNPDSDSSRGENDEERWQAGTRQFIRRHDTNDDGFVSRNELPAGMRSDFQRIDTDDNSQLSPAEIQQNAKLFRNRGRENEMPSSTPVEVTYYWIIDANAGRVNLNDIQQAYAALREMDQDQNGKISQTELHQKREQAVKQWCERCFNRLDKNKDSELSRSESQNSVFGADFSNYDRNDDSYLTKSEVQRRTLENLERETNVSRNRDDSHR